MACMYTWCCIDGVHVYMARGNERCKCMCIYLHARVTSGAYTLGASASTVCCSVLQCVAVCCSVLKCVDSANTAGADTGGAPELHSIHDAATLCNRLQQAATHCTTLNQTALHARQVHQLLAVVLAHPDATCNTCMLWCIHVHANVGAVAPFG